MMYGLPDISNMQKCSLTNGTVKTACPWTLYLTEINYSCVISGRPVKCWTHKGVNMRRDYGQGNKDIHLWMVSSHAFLKPLSKAVTMQTKWNTLSNSWNATRSPGPTIWWLDTYSSHVGLELVDFIFFCEPMSACNINFLLGLWGASLLCHNDALPFTKHQELYDTINWTLIGGVLWTCATLSYDGPHPENMPPWMSVEYTIWYQDPCMLFKNMLENPDFAHSFDYVPYQQFDTSC